MSHDDEIPDEMLEQMRAAVDLWQEAVREHGRASREAGLDSHDWPAAWAEIRAAYGFPPAAQAHCRAWWLDGLAGHRDAVN